MRAHAGHHKDVLPMSKRIGYLPFGYLLLTGPPQHFMEPYRGMAKPTADSTEKEAIIDNIEEFGVLEMNLGLLRGVPVPNRQCAIHWAPEVYQIPSVYHDRIQKKPRAIPYKEPKSADDIPWRPIVYVTSEDVGEKLNVTCMYRFSFRNECREPSRLPYQQDMNGDPLYMSSDMKRAIIHRMAIIDDMEDGPKQRLARLRLSQELLFDPWNVIYRNHMDRQEISMNDVDYFYVSMNGDIHRFTAHIKAHGVCGRVTLPYESESLCNSVPRLIQLSKMDANICIHSQTLRDIQSMIELEPESANIYQPMDARDQEVYSYLYDSISPETPGRIGMSHKLEVVNLPAANIPSIYFGSEGKDYQVLGIDSKIVTNFENVLDTFEPSFGDLSDVTPASC